MLYKSLQYSKVTQFYTYKRSFFYIFFLNILFHCGLSQEMIQFPVLYNRTLLLIHSKSNRLRLPGLPSLDVAFAVSPHLALLYCLLGHVGIWVYKPFFILLFFFFFEKGIFRLPALWINLFLILSVFTLYICYNITLLCMKNLRLCLLLKSPFDHKISLLLVVMFALSLLCIILT